MELISTSPSRFCSLGENGRRCFFTVDVPSSDQTGASGFCGASSKNLLDLFDFLGVRLCLDARRGAASVASRSLLNRSASLSPPNKVPLVALKQDGKRQKS